MCMVFSVVVVLFYSTIVVARHVITKPAATFIATTSSVFSAFRTTTTTRLAAAERKYRRTSISFILRPHLDLHSQQQQQQQQQIRLYNAEKDWDAIVANEDDDIGNGFDSSTKVSLKNKIPYDMKYNQRNCERCNQNFKAITDAGGPGADLYGCVAPSKSSIEMNEPVEGVFWFLGKVAHISDISIEDCIRRLYPMIQQHAANLRPLDLFGAVTNEQLDIWYAPINTELDVAYNRPTCVFTKITPPTTEIESNDIAKTIKSSYVGFQGEIYEPGEDGFRTLRYTNDGTPSRPEITGPVDVANDSEDDDDDDEENDDIVEDDNDMMVPNDEQMEQIQAALQGKDINAIYEEQERRRRANENVA